MVQIHLGAHACQNHFCLLPYIIMNNEYKKKIDKCLQLLWEVQDIVDTPMTEELVESIAGKLRRVDCMASSLAFDIVDNFDDEE